LSPGTKGISGTKINLTLQSTFTFCGANSNFVVSVMEPTP